MPLELRERFIARVYDRATSKYEELVRDEKRRLFEGLSGTGVELGPGTGANLALLPAGVRWIGVERSRHMQRRLRARAQALGLEVELEDPEGDRLPLEDGSCDFAIATLVLCSVRDPVTSIAELRRVLRPGGRLIFWEHVAAPEGTRTLRVQRWLTPFWRWYACGCNLDRDLGACIEAAGFERVELERFEAPREVAPPIVRPHIRGIATR